MAKALQRQRRKFWESDPRCHWCGIKTVWYDRPRGAAPWNSATIDHLDSRLNGQRGNFNGQIRHVLSCLKCNNKRCEDELKLERQRQRIKSGHTKLAEERGNLPREVIG